MPRASRVRPFSYRSIPKKRPRHCLPRPVVEMRTVLWFGAVFLRDFLTFAGEGPFTFDGLHFFARGIGDVVADLQILKEVHAELTGAGDVDVSVLVQINSNELRSGGGGSVDGEIVACEDGIGCRIGNTHGCDCAGGGVGRGRLRRGKLRACRQRVGVDDEGIVGAGVVSVVAAVALAGDELGRAVAVDVGEKDGVGLREGFVDGVAYPEGLVSRAGLFEPVESIAVALAVDQVHLAVVVDVVAENGEAGVAEI